MADKFVNQSNIETTVSKLKTYVDSGFSDYQVKIDSTNKLNADLVDDTDTINKFVTASEKGQIATNTNAISIINGKIPVQATSSNQLADKDFVNSSIATNTANFIGTFTSVDLLESVGYLVIYSILKEDSVIAKGSVVNGTTYDNDTTLDSDLNITADSTLAFGSVIKSGSTIEIGSIINHETYESQTTTSSDIIIDTITNNDYANVINQELDFLNTTDMNAYDKTLLTNFDYAWIPNGAKYDLYRFDIDTQTWGLRATAISKGDVTLITAYNRYTFNGNTQEWKWNYTVNTSGFTAAQWSAINSGITSSLVAQIGEKELFYCTYGTTTYAEITNALSAGKMPVCIYSNRLYVYAFISPTNRYMFNCQYYDTLYALNIQENNTWGTSSYGFEITSNKVTSISNASTDIQYPSAKCVYDNLLSKQDIIQYSTMPVASIDNVGQIIQFTGTTGTYKNGFFYKCVLDNGNYVWEEIVFGTTLTPLSNNDIDTIMGAILSPQIQTVSFTIDNVTYQAESDMTWGDWVDSEYNTGNFGVTQEYTINYNNMAIYVYYNSTIVVVTDTIVSNGIYTLAGGGGGD